VVCARGSTAANTGDGVKVFVVVVVVAMIMIMIMIIIIRRKESVYAAREELSE